MRLIDATFGALGLALLAGTAYAAADSDLTGARATPVQMEQDGFEAREGAEHEQGYQTFDGTDERRDGDEDGHAGASGSQTAVQPLSLQDAVARVGAMGYTRILEAELEHGRYEIEALDDQGRKVEIYLDAQTGQTIRQGYDD